ncbi:MULTISPECIES: acyl-CoA dehydrogenase [unclassified Ruegeria]|uniref:acyl-CoA dehydrogenase n=1 Tax=unclassified Ruegeria TaxID=2625375 RepID=UPI0014890F77|nr:MULTISPECIES: acyl-CoA dehydrogenase [unclassified Ruegeria]NOD78872.1 acyl-CoA dehydrogenase [Ruegeria sp. HKCCD4332]NOD91065.1 acyl-CoA dehydrogenase [Ruegeria sp. HKCCD4318]NOE16262.1 acyl-CoA dehydrogenase [Ruegeria sp. HKCCD4318-2]NOG07461.1 acyl-CoA dehydrogenase [Ruegeria sp. HKCCD4315]
MSYQPPVQDLMFCVEHLSHWEQVSSFAVYSDYDLADIGAVLEGYARFCSEQIAPLSHIGDTLGARFDNGRVTMPEGDAQAYAQFVEMGWQALTHPVEYGGMGLPKTVGAAAVEMLNAADMSFGLCPLLTDGAIEALLLTGSDEQKATYLEPLIAGRWSGTMNLTEPQAGSDLGRVATKAVQREDGSYDVSGTKIFITYGAHNLTENIIHLVLARTPDAPAGPKGLSLFIVPQKLVDADGTVGTENTVNCVSIEHKLGVRASPTAVLEYKQATGFLIGEENRGLEYMFIMMNAARFSVGVQGIATSERAYQRALTYARERVQSRPVNGQTKDAVAIIEHPDVRRMLMRMRGLTEGGRAMAAATAGLLDIAHHQDNPEMAALAEFMVPLVKGFCSERAVEVASLGVQIHGGMGFIEETGAAQHYRDARILPIYEGTTAIQANDLLGRKVMRDGGETARLFAARIAETEAQLARGDANAQAIGASLAQAREAFESALNWLLENSRKDIDAAFAGSVPFLMLAGTLAAGWKLAKGALAAQSSLDAEQDAQFMAQKIATALFFAQHILPECTTEHSRILLGARSLLDAHFPE